MKTTQRTILSAALAVLLCPFAGQAAFAQSTQTPRIAELRIQVLEAGSRRDLGYVNPGGSITVPEGSTIRLIMTALPAGNGRPLYPETEFTDPSNRGMRITRASEENANATIQVPSLNNGRERSETLRFQITENVNLPANQRTGSITLRVVPGQPAQTGSGSTGTAVPATGRSRELVTALYRGILLRDPDESGARNFISDVERNGFNGLVNAAQVIARSEESRIQVYERENVCNQQRLLSLYKNLLGLGSNEIDSGQWDAYLRQLNSGDVAGVVQDMMLSDRFRSYQRLS
ncbi:MAG TPA: hypothetical protein VEL74_23670 [Thermoanaerobaculia bacterium]|nr:hypothetical protein [Thermoanaerobaculia bacterium]